MFSSAALHSVAYFAILAGIFSYLYVQHRHVSFLLWGLGWTALAFRQIAIADITPAVSPVVTDGALVVAGLLVLLGGAMFGSAPPTAAARTAAWGLLVALVAVAVVGGLAVFASHVDTARAVALGILASSWVGAGLLVDRRGRAYSPHGARIAGLALAAWGVWLPVEIALGDRPAPPLWPSEVDAALGAVVGVGMAILVIEFARARARQADPRRLIDEDPNMIAIIQDRRIAYANPVFQARIGRTLSELRGLDATALIAPELKEEALLRRERREKGEPIGDYETQIVDAEGARLAVVVHGDPMEWDGRPAFKYELTDVTERRQAEAEVGRVNAELRRMNAELENANRLQSEFLSNTTHELKTPLTSIMANTEILEYEMCGPITPEQRRVLGTIGRNSQHLLEMISRLLDFARARSGAGILRLEEVDPREILDGVSETVRPLMEGRDLALEVEVAPGVGPCWLDGEKIYRVYLNLVENAVKFSPRGTIRMTACAKSGEFEGSVVDQGIGIPGERHEEIFEAFRQVDASSTRAYPGVGLGLAICRQLIELHGGRIWVESKAGEGSAFRFRVPCLPPPAA